MNTPNVKPPAEPQETFLYIRTPVTPEQAFKAIGALRREAVNEIHRLIQFLDKTDDYVSRELEDAVDDNPCDDNELEPGFCGVTADGASLPGASSWIDEAEGDDTPSGRSAEEEPTLGSVAAHEWSSQSGWSQGGTSDLEEEHDGGEPDVDDEHNGDWEPSLGRPERDSQRIWPGAAGDHSDYRSPELI